MPRSIVAILVAGALTFSAPVILSAQKGHGPKVKTNTTPKAQGGGTKAHGGSKVQSGPKVHANGPRTKATHASAGGGKKTQTAVSTTSTTTTSKGKSKNTTMVATTGAGTGTTLTPVQQKLQRNTNLASKLQSRLPAGTDMMKAAEGFRNLGQFVAAVNVSNNLGLSFTQLKTRMVDDGMSLGQAIKELRPTANSTTEVQRAETDASRLITTTEGDVSPKKKSRG